MCLNLIKYRVSMIEMRRNVTLHMTHIKQLIIQTYRFLNNHKKKRLTEILIKGLGELVKSWRNLQPLLKDTLLPLKTD